MLYFCVVLNRTMRAVEGKVDRKMEYICVVHGVVTMLTIERCGSFPGDVNRTPSIIPPIFKEFSAVFMLNVVFLI